MKFPKITIRRSLATIILLAGLTCLALLVINIRSRASNEQTPTQANTKSQNQPGKNPAAAIPQPKSSTLPTETTTESSSPACQQFTLATAKSILGPKTALIVQDSTVSSETNDLLVSSCAYQVSNTSTVRLSVYAAKTTLGESANAVAFGSEKPGGVQDVPGYGQAAYWDARTGVLSVLEHNNRYDISRDAGSNLEDVKQAANGIIPNL